MLTADAVNSINTFDKPENVKPTVFNGFKVSDNGFTATLPAKSIVALELQ